MSNWKKVSDALDDGAQSATKASRKLVRNVVRAAEGFGLATTSLVKEGLERTANSLHELETKPGDVVLDLPRTLQLDGYSCGAQSAVSILRYFGKGRSVPRTLRLLGTDKDGTAVGPIRDLFRARGLRPVVLRSPTKQSLIRAIDAGAPLLVAVDDSGHWSVLYGYGRGSIFLMDPSLRRALRVRWHWSEFKARWDGWAMAVHGA